MNMRTHIPQQWQQWGCLSLLGLGLTLLLVDLAPEAMVLNVQISKDTVQNEDQSIYHILLVLVWRVLEQCWNGGDVNIQQCDEMKVHLLVVLRLGLWRFKLTLLACSHVINLGSQSPSLHSVNRSE
jgi:hypothetical protein